MSSLFIRLLWASVLSHSASAAAAAAAPQAFQNFHLAADQAAVPVITSLNDMVDQQQNEGLAASGSCCCCCCLYALLNWHYPCALLSSQGRLECSLTASQLPGASIVPMYDKALQGCNLA